MKPLEGTGAFRWSTGGWFGSQIGGTGWMIPYGIIAALKSLLPGLFILGCAILANVIGHQLWKRRDRIHPYPAVQMLVFEVGVISAMVLWVGYQTNLIAAFDARYSENPEKSFWILLMFPMIAAYFAFLEKAGRRRRAQNAEQGSVALPRPGRAFKTDQGD